MRSLVRRGARRAVQGLPGGARAGLLRSAGRLAPGRVPGLVTVVVVCEPVDLPRLGDAVESVRVQGHELLDVLVLPVGPAALADDVAAAMGGGADDPRLRIAAPVPDLAAACVAAGRLARGSHLTVLRGCDLLLPGAVGELLAAVRHGGGADGHADGGGAVVASGGVEQFGAPDPWLRETQAGPVGGDLRLLGRLWDVRAWRAAGDGSGTDLPGTAVDPWLCSAFAARLVAGAEGRVARVGPVYRYAHDHGRRAFGATPSPLPELAHWPARAAAIEEALAAGPARLREEWRQHLADVELPRLVADAERATGEEWAALVAWTRTVGVPARRVTARALLYLAAEDRRTDAERFAEELLLLEGALRTRVEDDRVLLLTEVGLPESVRRLTEHETPLVTHLRRRAPLDPASPDGPVLAEVWTRIEHVDLAGRTPQFWAYAADGTPLEVSAGHDRRAERWARQRFQSAAAGVCRVVLGPEVLAGGAAEVRLVVRVDGVVRDGVVRVPGCASTGSASVGGSGSVGVPGGASTGSASVGGVLTDVRVEDDAVVLSGDGREVRTRLWRWSFGERQWLPPGVYPVEQGDARPAAALLDRLPLEEVRAHHRVTLRQGPGGGLVLDLAPPFDDSEAGPYHQERLRAAYASVARSQAVPTSPDVVYLESYAGRTATDSPAAILAELLRRYPGLEAYWGVLDHSHSAPAGATPVLLRSRAHYEVLGRASLVVSNTDLDEWFVHRPDQLVVQTFHGYPSKAMGAVQWAAKELTPAQVRAIRRRTVDTWDLITTPTPAMTEHYRVQYAYEGPVSERGYPRDDLLTPGSDGAPTVEASARRRATRALLGIREGVRAVLYAPTWRDHLATRPRAAEMADHLDLVAAARALGPGYVILLRGHRFHTPDALAGDATAARIVDVTAYPEVNDLILASDAAVLDYSSLRFDYALTGRPMVFCVPDLDEYAGGARGFLYPFTDSAPGPLVATTDEVVDQLRDLPALAAAWSGEIERFNRRYHPYQDGHATERVVDEIARLWRGSRTAQL